MTTNLTLPARLMVFAVMLSALMAMLGCVSIDSRALSETVDKAATRKMAGEFSNLASYFSSGEFVGRNNLAELLRVFPAKNAGRVRVSVMPDDSLRLTWYSGDREVATRTYDAKSGLKIAQDGAFEIQVDGKWASGEGAAGYQSLYARLFLNSKGELCAVQSGGGGGLVGPFPIGIYARHLSVFARLQ